MTTPSLVTTGFAGLDCSQPFRGPLTRSDGALATPAWHIGAYRISIPFGVISHTYGWGVSK